MIIIVTVNIVISRYVAGASLTAIEKAKINGSRAYHVSRYSVGLQAVYMQITFRLPTLYLFLWLLLE